MSAVRKPPTMDDAAERGLLADAGIHTFSNGSEWESWSANNCDRCRHFNPERAGQCAFESAAWLDMVSPALALLFGWTEDEAHPGDFDKPDTCAFRWTDDDDDDDDRPRPPAPVDPAQLVLLADPTEDAAILTSVDVDALTPAVAP